MTNYFPLDRGASQNTDWKKWPKKSKEELTYNQQDEINTIIKKYKRFEDIPTLDISNLAKKLKLSKEKIINYIKTNPIKNIKRRKNYE